MPALPNQLVPYGPVPLLYYVGWARTSDGKELVVLIIDHRAGRDIHHLPPEHALALARALEANAILAGAPASPVTATSPPQGVLPFRLGNGRG